MQADSYNGNAIDGRVYTKVFKSKTGAEVLVELTFRGKIPEVKYGLISKKAPYKQPNQLKNQPKMNVFYVEKPTKENIKKLTEIIRNEVGFKGLIHFIGEEIAKKDLLRKEKISSMGDRHNIDNENQVYTGNRYGCEVDGEFTPLKDFLSARWWMNDVDGEPV